MWGRKDGFPGADGSTITQDAYPNLNAKTNSIYKSDGQLTQLAVVATAAVDEGAATLNYSIKNPTSFIYNTNIPYDWYTNTENQNNNLWQPDRKSIYDPCPYGWRIPIDASTYDDFSQTSFPYYIQGSVSFLGDNYATNGRLYKHISWYPAGGCYHAVTGYLCTVGEACYSWYSSTVGTDAGIMGFNKDSGGAGGKNFRAYGFSVRCIQE